MKKVLLAASLLCLAACTEQPRTPPAPGALLSPMPARGANGRQDLSRMDNPMEISPCGYASLTKECAAK